ncbi:MAG TPA: extracellular solute-binding protein [Candidatus Limnocylindrales bacterium]|nr:extracellular solute-binding protein [Candidatus Limnocylindrales bacterium]
MHSRSRITGLLATIAIVVSACGGNTASPAATGGGSTAAATGGATTAPGTPAAPASFAPAALRWYCCLGTGEDPSQVPTENQVADGFAAKHPGSSLKLEVVTYQAARDTLSTQIGGGNSPDVVGPTGVGGLAAFQGQWLDLAPYIAKTGYDTSQYDPSAVAFYNTPDGQIGLPFAIYPSMVWYKADMFTEAGLAEPPHKYGDQYTLDGQQVEWNYDTLRQIAMRLTVDKAGKDATQAGFDPKNIVQYGFEPQRDDLRGLGAYWGAGNLAGGADGKTVTIPEDWKTAWKFFYDGMWKDHFIMTGPVYQTDQFNGGGYAFFSGRVAMSENFLWTTYGVADSGKDWNLAAIPANNGKVTSPLNADTFAVLKGTKNPDAAWAALQYILDDSADTLLGLYGGMPARPEKQDAFFTSLTTSKGFEPTVDWQVAKDSVQYADNPNFEAPMPKYNETLTILSKYLSKWTATPGLDMDAEIEAMRAEIQAKWDS